MLKSALKIFICVTLIITVVLSSFIFASAENSYPHGHITIDKVTALNGDSVILKLKMENNPGIMAMTISITYDSSALSYEKYYFGYLGDYTVADHPDKNLIRLVNCESRNRFENATMISLQFKVKDDAEFGFYPVDIEYKSGDFCNWKLEKFMPEITAGGVNIEYSGENCKHKKYGEWETAAEPACVKNGAKQRKCEKCGHIDIDEIPAIGHEYAREWTVDKAATAETSGVMSRHCIRCDAATDTLTFGLPKEDKPVIENTVGSTVKPSDTTDKLLEEQLPDVFKENGGTSLPPENKDEPTNDGATELPKPDEIIEGIEKNSTGRVAKILEAIPDFEIVKKLFSAAMLIMLRLFMV